MRIPHHAHGEMKGAGKRRGGKGRNAANRVSERHTKSRLHLEIRRRADSIEKGKRASVAAHEKMLPVVHGVAPVTAFDGISPTTENRPLLDEADGDPPIGEAKRGGEAGKSATNDENARSQRSQVPSQREATRAAFRFLESPIRRPNTK